MPQRAFLRVVVAALVGLACDDGAVAGSRSERAAPDGTRAVVVAHRAAGARTTRPPRAARGPAVLSPGPPPGPGYCWHYIDRSTHAPGFWDMCRER